MRRLVVWHNLNKDTYYYKFINTYYADYKPGYRNQYNHEVILVIESSILTPTITKVSLFALPINLLINLLKLVIKFLEKLASII